MKKLILAVAFLLPVVAQAAASADPSTDLLFAAVHNPETCYNIGTTAAAYADYKAKGVSKAERMQRIAAWPSNSPAERREKRVSTELAEIAYSSTQTSTRVLGFETFQLCMAGQFNGE